MKIAMTRNLGHMVLTTGLSTLLTIAIGGAQSLSEVADVPFTFHAEGKTFAAGKYQVKAENSSGLFKITGSDRKSIFTNVRIPKTTDPSRPHLTFARYRSGYVLYEISMPGKDVAYAASKSAIDKNLPHKLGVAAMISVPLKSH